jgi:hypothetical protein
MRRCDTNARRFIPLVHDALLVPVNVFHRVFNGDDMAGRIAVTVVDQRRQGGGLTGAGRPYKQHQPPLGHHHVFQDRRQAEGIGIRSIGFRVPWNLAQGGAPVLR